MVETTYADEKKTVPMQVQVQQSSSTRSSASATSVAARCTPSIVPRSHRKPLFVSLVVSFRLSAVFLFLMKLLASFLRRRRTRGGRGPLSSYKNFHRGPEKMNMKIVFVSSNCVKKSMYRYFSATAAAPSVRSVQFVIVPILIQAPCEVPPCEVSADECLQVYHRHRPSRSRRRGGGGGLVIGNVSASTTSRSRGCFF